MIQSVAGYFGLQNDLQAEKIPKADLILQLRQCGSKTSLAIDS